MKIERGNLAGAGFLLLAAVGSVLYASGFGGLVVNYVPSLGGEVIANARETAWLKLHAGVFVMLAAAWMGGKLARTSPKLAVAGCLWMGLVSLAPLVLRVFA